MKFDFAGSQFQIEFQRSVQDVTLTRRVKREAEDGSIEVVTDHTVQKSQHPYTTARLSATGPLGTAPQVLIEASVGCAPSDKYSVAEGRVQALRKLTKAVPEKELRKAIWQAYSERGVVRK